MALVGLGWWTAEWAVEAVSRLFDELASFRLEFGNGVHATRVVSRNARSRRSSKSAAPRGVSASTPPTT